MACTKSLILLPRLRSSLSGLRAISTQVIGGLQSNDLTTKTHTGQVFDKDDYRNARFEHNARIVNKQFAINLVAEEPIEMSSERVVACNGGGGPLGHPKVYINLDKPGAHACGYCGKRFQKKDDHH